MSTAVSWQEMLDLFTTEIKETKHSETWAKFQTLHTEQELMQFVYDLDVFRKRINAWHSKNARTASVPNTNVTCEILPVARRRDIREVVTLAHGSNSSLPGASSAVALRCSPEKGRHIVATRDIVPGDTLFLEEPFASVMCDTQDTHCEFCCLPLPRTPMKCSACAMCNYCSSECLASAAHQYHTFECGSSLPGHVGIARLGLRVTLVAESLGCLGDAPVAESSTWQQYQRVLQLVTHLTELTPEDKLQYALTSLLLVVDQARRRKVGASQRPAFCLQFGARILRHVTQLVCNGNAISCHLLQDSIQGGLMQEKQLRVATAIYPSAAMMDHSCDPNIQTSYVGRTLIARAATHIRQGEEVLNCYGPHFRNSKTEARRAQLQQQYFFLCQCRPCTSPRDFLEQSGIDAARCPKCRGPVTHEDVTQRCLQCTHVLSKDQVQQLRHRHALSADALHEADQLVEAGDFAAAAKCVAEALKQQRLFLHANNRRISASLDYLAMLEARQGNYMASLEQLELSLPLLEHWHGAHSVEVSGVLDTMLDIAGQCLTLATGPRWNLLRDNALSWCLQAQHIVSTLLGPWHHRMPALNATQEFLLNVKAPVPK